VTDQMLLHLVLRWPHYFHDWLWGKI